MLQHEDELVCDLAEYYGIVDIEALPVNKLAGLSCGLPPESRTMMKLSGQKIPINTMLLATIADRLSILCWQNTKDGKNNRNRPVSILSELLRDNTEKNYAVFSSGEEFVKAWNDLVKEE